MTTAITSTGNSTEATFDSRFGRCNYFCLLDENNKEVSFIKNEQTHAQSGAGTKVVEKMAELNVKKIISGDFGPKAKKLLEKFNIQMIIIEDEKQKINDIINTLK